MACGILYIINNLSGTELQHTWQRTVSHCYSIEEMISWAGRCKIQNYNTIGSSQLAILHNNEEINMTTNQIIRDTCRLQFSDTALQENEELLSRYSQQKTRFDDQEERKDNTL